MKKPPQKVAYLSRNSVFSEYSSFTAQQPKWQKSCSKMSPIEQLYIELGQKAIFIQVLGVYNFDVG